MQIKRKLERNVPAMVRNRLFVKGLVITIVLLFSILTLVFITGTHSLYVDIVNGNEKHVRRALGLTYSVKTNVTAYSLLITRFGLQDNPDWRLAAHYEMRDFLHSNHICFSAGESIVAMDALATLVELNEVENPPDVIRQLRLLLKGKDTSVIPKYIQSLSKDHSTGAIKGAIKGTDPIKESSFRNQGADSGKEKEPIDLRR